MLSRSIHGTITKGVKRMLDREKVRELLALDNLLESLEKRGLDYGRRENRCHLPNTDPDMQAIMQILQNRYDRIFGELTADSGVS